MCVSLCVRVLCGGCVCVRVRLCGVSVFCVSLFVCFHMGALCLLYVIWVRMMCLCVCVGVHGRLRLRVSVCV